MSKTFNTASEANAEARRVLAENGRPKNEVVVVFETCGSKFEVGTWPATRVADLGDDAWVVRLQ